ncbi:hypothetical protein FHS88_000709 [Roseomonas alkaliterrae]|jgi:hypothetical protein|uniref:Uncharacterized protein n=1 Tax=Neoroseomonas alkaliterrae TaxID=1452450 RepID=A0A840Y2Z4_9PROT|nr:MULTISPECIES: hypothetical protein [Rhodospirillales]MBB5688593.1 hypothetical protein [Neoroseomonas alkaliterrae]GIX10697.1 MAG: hypothetical protein KatS3mg116_2407 [Elioraea sp.]
MSEGQPPLDAEAVDLILEILELREPLLSGAAAELGPRAAALLKAAGLLVPHDHEAVSASLADHEDTPVSLIWSEAAGGFAYFSPAVGPVAVPRERLVRHRVDIDVVLDAVAERLDRPRNRPAFPLVDGLLWELGDVRIGRRRERDPLWFTRRLGDPAVNRQVAEAARARPNTRQRVILTSTRPARLTNVAIPGAVVVALHDVLAAPDRLAVSPDILDARLRGVPPVAAGPLVLSPDGTKLSINDGDPILFRSEAQKEAIRKLVDAFYAGTRLRARDLTHHHSLQTFFGKAKWSRLAPFLKSDGGLWGFEP